MKHFISLICVSLLVANAQAQYPSATVPEFSFYKLDNTLFTNKNLAPAKLSLIVFFDASCEHCQHAMTIYNKHYQELKKTAVYLVTLDNKQTIDYFLTKYGDRLYSSKNVTILQDLKNQFVAKFHPRRYPSMFLYDTHNKLLIYDDEPNNIGNFLQKIKANS